MSSYRLTSAAQADRDGIARYTKHEHGERQCASYLDTLEDCFERLAGFPGMGTTCDEVRPGLRRWPHDRHAVFYVRKSYVVRIIRVLHETMDPKRHDFRDDEGDA